MENQPQNIIAIGRKRLPIEEIALVEPFEPPAEQSPRFTTDKEFKTRVVLIDRYSLLTEDTVEAFAEANKFRRLPDDNVATNPAVRFRVETFEPSEGFQPRKPYQSRLKWRDQDGNEQSKLLVPGAPVTRAKPHECASSTTRYGARRGAPRLSVRRERVLKRRSERALASNPSPFPFSGC
jgi:hypothetical protein